MYHPSWAFGQGSGQLLTPGWGAAPALAVQGVLGAVCAHDWRPLPEIMAANSTPVVKSTLGAGSLWPEEAVRGAPGTLFLPNQPTACFVSIYIDMCQLYWVELVNRGS